MNKCVRTLFFALFPAIFLSACGSGTSASNAGGAGTNTGTTNYILFASTDPTFTSSDTGACVDPVTDLPDPKLIETDPVTLNITLQDQTTGLTTLQNRGVTFDNYRLVYTPINQGIPIPLTPRQRALTVPVPLPNGATSTAVAVDIVLVDLETKAEYISRDSGSVNTYNVTITYLGRDFITNQPVTLVTNTQMEIGALECDTDVGGPPDSYSVGGTVFGVLGTLVLQNNGGDDLPISGILGVATDVNYTFPTELIDGSSYSVTVKTQPSGQICDVIPSNSSGIVNGADVTNVTVICN
ncbi:hypothetical protein ACFL1S_06725 [Pseudomonadota bacterium]